MRGARPPRLHSARVVTLLAALVLGAAVAACGPGGTLSPSPTSPGVIPSSPVAGVVVAVQSQGLTNVHGFTLRTVEGDLVNFTLGNLDNPTAFPPGHLAEHQASAAPVLVWFNVEGSNLVVYHLQDAP